jgi:hypothetical protein
MKKLNRKSFALMLNDLDTMEKLNILLELFDNLSKECTEKSDFRPLKDFLNKYINHKVKYINRKSQ